jgi:hypothetical protein
MVAEPTPFVGEAVSQLVSLDTAFHAQPAPAVKTNGRLPPS